jgi:hypothetical protein
MTDEFAERLRSEATLLLGNGHYLRRITRLKSVAPRYLGSYVTLQGSTGNNGQARRAFDHVVRGDGVVFVVARGASAVDIQLAV